MKKILVSVLFALATSFVVSEEFTWGTYEALCMVNGKEPSYEEYIYLVENPQCYGEQ